MDIILWFSWKIPHRQQRRVCKQQLYTVMQKFWNNSQNISCWITLEHKSNCDFHLALAWAINSKNSLSNIYGFSPYQLSISTNPKLPCKAPAITSTPTNKTIIKNLGALLKAREAFIASENSWNLRRALSHNIRTSGDIKYLTGDSVYFKRLNSNQ